MDKIFCAIIAGVLMLSLLSLDFSTAIENTMYLAPNIWATGNNCYLGFNQSVSFSGAPHKGVPFGDGLSGYWKMDEGTGSVVTDERGNFTGDLLGVNNGVAYGTTGVAGKFGDGLNFNGASRVVVPDSSSLDLTVAGTISCWVYFSSLPSTGRAGLLYKRVGQDYYFLSIDSSGKVSLNLYNGVKSGTISSAKTVSPNAWHHIVGVIGDKGVNKLYIDSQKDPSESVAIELNPQTSQLYIGSEGASNFFTGIIDDVHIYNRALSGSEIKNLYDNIQVSSNLVGEWLFDDIRGTVVVDTHMWTTGVYGDSINFDGKGSYVNLQNMHDLSFASAWAVSAYIYPTVNTAGQVLVSGNNLGTNWVIETNSAGLFQVRAGTWTSSPSSVSIDLNIWQLWTIVFDGTYLKFYKNDILVGTSSLSNRDVFAAISPTIQIGACSKNNTYFSGCIDELRIYARSIDLPEIRVLYTQGPFSHPDAVLFVDHYTFMSSVDDSVMLISIDNVNGGSVLVNCTAFFTGNILKFCANSTVNVNIWTNLGQPVFSNGLWNTENYTTTLVITPLSVGQISWAPGAPPSASDVSVSSIIMGKPTSFSVYWNDLQSLSGGGYFFSTNNTGQWVNSTWVAFSSTPSWGNVSLTLINGTGVIVGFREYANNSLNLWADSGVYTITTSDDPSASSNPETTSDPSLTPPIIIPTDTPSSSPTQSAASSGSLNEIVLSVISITIVVVVVGVLVLFKRGHLLIEVTD